MPITRAQPVANQQFPNELAQAVAGGMRFAGMAASQSKNGRKNRLWITEEPQ